MEDQTTTVAPVTPGVEPTQPVVAEPTTAATEPSVAPTEPEPAQPSVEPSKDAPSDDDELSSWAEKKGLTLDSDNAKKAAKMAREAERAMHQKAQRASELEKSISTKSDEYAEEVAQVTGQDPELVKRLQRIEVRESVRDFWDANPDARQYESQMIELLQTKPHLAGDLESLYASALVKSGNLDAVKSQGKREALESLAHKQQAAVPTGNATNSGITPKTKPFNELSIAEMEAQLGFARR